MDGNVLKRTEVAAALRNTQKHSHAVVAPQKTFDERKVAAFRKFCTDFFDEGNHPEGPAGAGPARRGQAQGQARRTQGHRHWLEVPVRGAARRAHRPARTSRRQARRLVPDRLQPRRRAARSQGDLIDPIQSFLNGAQRSSTTRQPTLLTTHSSNLGYLPVGQRRDGRSGAGRPQRLPRQQDGAAQAGGRRPAQPDRRASSPRTAPSVVEAIEGRKAELLGSAFYAKATPRGTGEGRSQRVDQTIARVGCEKQIALIREHRDELRGERSTRRCSTSSPHPSRGATATPTPPSRSRRSRSRRSRLPGYPVSSRPKRTSTSTSPLSATRCSSRP